MCAGPYSQRLLGLDPELSDRFEAALLRRAELLRPGYTRLSPSWCASDAEADYILEAVRHVADHGHRFLPQYRFHHRTGEWRHATRLTRWPERRWLATDLLAAAATGGGRRARRGAAAAAAAGEGGGAEAEEGGAGPPAGEGALARAREEVAALTAGLVREEQGRRKRKGGRGEGRAAEGLGPEVEHLRWFWYPWEETEGGPGGEGGGGAAEGELSIRPERYPEMVAAMSSYLEEGEEEGVAAAAAAAAGGQPGGAGEGAGEEVAASPRGPTRAGAPPAPGSSRTAAPGRTRAATRRGRRRWRRMAAATGCASVIQGRAVPPLFFGESVSPGGGGGGGAGGRRRAAGGRRAGGGAAALVKMNLAAVAAGEAKLFPAPPKKMMRTVGTAIKEWGMIKEGDRLCLGLSGGKDSLALLHVLLALQRKAPIRFELACATVDPMTASFDPRPLIPYLASLGVTYHYLEEPIIERAKTALQGDSICSFCSRMKRGLLYKCLRDHGYTKLVLAQHLDDLAESFVMSAFHNGQLRTMKAHYRVDKGDLSVIRPLCYTREAATKAFARQARLPVINENCPACFEQPKERARVKQMLAK
ncbi:unnamed protein product, partial [Heterosigma akashiwo]